MRTDRFIRELPKQMADTISPDELAEYLNATCRSQGGGWKVKNVSQTLSGGMKIEFGRPSKIIGGSCYARTE